MYTIDEIKTAIDRIAVRARCRTCNLEFKCSEEEKSRCKYEPRFDNYRELAPMENDVQVTVLRIILNECFKIVEDNSNYALLKTKRNGRKGKMWYRYNSYYLFNPTREHTLFSMHNTKINIDGDVGFVSDILYEMQTSDINHIHELVNKK